MRKSIIAVFISLCISLMVALPVLAADTVKSSTITISAENLLPGYYLCAIWDGEELLRLYDCTVEAAGKINATVEVGKDFPAGKELQVGISRTDPQYTEPIVTQTVKVNAVDITPSTGGGGGTGGSGGASGGAGGGGGSTVTTSDKPEESVNTDNNKTFSDVPANAWYADAVKYVTDNGMMKGSGDGSFSPDEVTTRGQLVTILYRLEKEPPAGTTSFSDIKSDQYYAAAVAWASSNNVVKGYENGTFGANDNLTREQIAVILFRYAELKSVDVIAKSDLSGFADSAKVSGWAAPAMQWAVARGLIKGDDGALNPQGEATRAEIATILMRYCESIAK